MEYKVWYGICFVCCFIAVSAVACSERPSARLIDLGLKPITFYTPISNILYRQNGGALLLFPSTDGAVNLRPSPAKIWSLAPSHVISVCPSGWSCAFEPTSYFSYGVGWSKFYYTPQPLWNCKVLPIKEGLLKKQSTPQEIYQEQRRREAEQKDIAGPEAWISQKELQACKDGESQFRGQIKYLLASVDRLREWEKIK